MGIFVEETAAFIIGGIIGGALLYINLRAKTEGPRETYILGWVFLVVCLILAVIGVMDVAIDHLGSDAPQAATP